MEQGAEPVIVLGHEFWRTTFAADPGVVGRTVELNRRAFTVVGVLFLYYSERRRALGSASVSRDEPTSVPVLGGASQTSPTPWA